MSDKYDKVAELMMRGHVDILDLAQALRESAADVYKDEAAKCGCGLDRCPWLEKAEAILHPGEAR